MTSNNRYDIIIIGTGAGGGTLAYRLAPTGKRILLLERGDFVPREKDNWSSRAVNVDAKYHTKDVWKDRTGAPLHPHTNYYVGGNTKFYGAALFRLRERDFGELNHSGGWSPAWPISYDELEPYYMEAERLYHVHGERGVDPTDPWASAAYPHPAVRHEPRIQQLHDDLVKRGLRPFHVPLGIMLDEQNPLAGKCIRCETCDGFPCLIGAKSDAHIVCIEPAIARSNVTLLTNAKVTRLETSASGREVTGVVVERLGELETYSADIVVSACGAINSAGLLLRSANDRHPRGLANGSDVVGRHYMGHINSVLLAISKTPNPTVFQKTLGIIEVVVGTLEADVLRTRVGADPAQELGKGHAAPFADGAPAFHADVPRDLVLLRHGAQVGKGPVALVGDQAGDFQPVARLVDLANLVLAVVGVERKRPRDHRVRIGRRELVRVEDPALDGVVEARDAHEGRFDAGVVADAAAAQQGKAAQRERALQESAARGRFDAAADQLSRFGERGFAVDSAPGPDA